eukprot:snap_masked-scaffold_6-processed-gene-3.15-mRNA-1 protein AED:1.00 eAED:1.00 QI:0/0/0/0/1/1/3/0/442
MTFWTRFMPMSLAVIIGGVWFIYSTYYENSHTNEQSRYEDSPRRKKGSSPQGPQERSKDSTTDSSVMSFEQLSCCPSCKEEFDHTSKHPVIFFPCNHKLCVSCSVKILEICKVCKQKIDQRSLHQHPNLSSISLKLKMLASEKIRTFWLTVFSQKQVEKRVAMKIQICGVLLRRWGRMKPGFNVKTKVSPWEERFFILKDGFLLWYKPVQENGKLVEMFQFECKGCLPISNAQIFPSGSKGENFYFEIGVDLSLTKKNTEMVYMSFKTKNKKLAKEWISLLESSVSVNFDKYIKELAFSSLIASEAQRMNKKRNDCLCQVQKLNFELKEVEKDKLKRMEIISKEKKKHKKKVSNIRKEVADMDELAFIRLSLIEEMTLMWKLEEETKILSRLQELKSIKTNLEEIQKGVKSQINKEESPMTKAKLREALADICSISALLKTN